MKISVSGKTDRGKKMRIYRREHVAHLWYVTPGAQTLEVYRLEGSRYLLVDTFEASAHVGAEPFEVMET